MNESDENKIKNEQSEGTGADKNTGERAEQRSDEDYVGDTDRVTGEYHYKNGFTQKIYSDAHFVPADETTAPPRYYAPPEKPPKDTKPRKERQGVSTATKIVCLCLVCAILGGIGGAALVGKRLGDRVATLEAAAAATPVPVVTSGSSASTSSGSTGSTSGVMSPAEIYAMACEQVVGITSEITTTNFFGYSSSAALSGSGFIATSDGYIITNYHVVEYAYEGGSPVTVMLHDGTEYEASIVGVEDGNDIAVLKIDASDLNAVTVGDSSELRVGDAVYPVGNPLGELEFSMSSGHVSALDRVITTSEGGDSINMFQMDAAVNSGNSGGPVYNDQGQVVGIVTAKYSSTGVEGLGFAIPSNDAAAIANDLITLGYVAGKAYLGVVINNNYNSMYAQYYKWPEGAFVDSVESGSCAAAAGIQSGDIITKLGEVDVASYAELRQALKQYSAGDTVAVELYRKDESISLTVTLDEAVPDTAATPASEELSELPTGTEDYSGSYQGMQPGMGRP